jgi:hypothetical protein
MLKRIYEFLGLPFYKHNLNNIEQSAMFEHDNAYFREKTDHRTQPKLTAWGDPVRVLSAKFHQQVVNNNSWFYKAFYPEVLQ